MRVNVYVVKRVFEKLPQTWKYIGQSTGHSFNWSVLLPAPRNNRTRKNLKAIFMAEMKPSLNEKVESNALNLFHNSIMYSIT